MGQLEYLLQTGHWQVLTSTHHSSPNERDAAKEAFVEKCLKPILEELDELRDILFNHPSLQVISTMHPVARLRRSIEMGDLAAEFAEERDALKHKLTEARADGEAALEQHRMVQQQRDRLHKTCKTVLDSLHRCTIVGVVRQPRMDSCRWTNPNGRRVVEAMDMMSKALAGGEGN